MKHYLMIADAHIAGDEQETLFFQLLDDIKTLPTSVSVVFLGDVFELWIAVENYESPAHLRFLQWCKTEKNRGREVFFCEGNHEFFLYSGHKEFFTDCGRRVICRDGAVFLHGDTLNKRDIPYFLLRCAVRNHFTKLLLWIFGKTIGPKLSDKIRLRLKTTNMVNKKHFPENHVRDWGKELKERDIHCAFLGHFHRQVDLNVNGVEIHVLPAYQNTRLVGFYEPQTQTYSLHTADKLNEINAELQQKGYL